MPSRDQPVEQRPVVRRIFRVQEGVDALADDVLARRADHVAVALVDVQQDAVQAGLGHADRGLLEQARHGLAAQQRGLSRRFDSRRRPARARPPRALARQPDCAVHARPQLARAEGLDQVVVGAGAQAFQPRFFAGARRQQDQRHAAGGRIGAQRRQQREAVQLGHHDVGQHQVRQTRRDWRRATASSAWRPLATASTS